MNLHSFVDEVIKLGGVTVMVKRSASGSTEDIPAGLGGSGSVPESITTTPDEAATRLPATGHLPAAVEPGTLGKMTNSRAPIDRPRFNRPLGDSR